MHTLSHDPVMAEFAAPEPVIAAILRLRELGVVDIDVFAPYPVRAIEEALEIRRSKIPFLAFAMALAGGGLAYFVQWWMNAYAYPLDVGGRPPHMPSAFVPVTFEMAVLSCALTAFLAVMFVARLPSPWRREFEIDGFESVSTDRFWMAVPLQTTSRREDALQVLRESGALQLREQP